MIYLVAILSVILFYCNMRKARQVGMEYPMVPSCSALLSSLLIKVSCIWLVIVYVKCEEARLHSENYGVYKGFVGYEQPYYVSTLNMDPRIRH